MVDQERWRKAQRYEALYWHRASRLVEHDEHDLSWYEWRADRLARLLTTLGLEYLLDGDADVLEVGSGPVGLLGFFPAERAVAVDPLADHFSRLPGLSEFRTGGVHYHKAMGEGLPFADGVFDLVVIENCIDHVRDVDEVMRELARVLTDDGVLYLTVNCRSRWGYYIHRLLSRLNLDRGHPHTFTAERLRWLTKRHGFHLLNLDPGSVRDAWGSDLLSGKPKAVMKALLGVSEAPSSVIARLEN